MLSIPLIAWLALDEQGGAQNGGAQNGGEQDTGGAQHGGAALWVPLVTVSVLYQICIEGSFMCITIACNATVPGRLRGSMNGVLVSLGSAFAALGPAVSSVLFAWTVQPSVHFASGGFWVMA